MGLGLKVAMALPADGVAYNISRNNEYIQKIGKKARPLMEDVYEFPGSGPCD